MTSQELEVRAPLRRPGPTPLAMGVGFALPTHHPPTLHFPIWVNFWASQRFFWKKSSLASLAPPYMEPRGAGGAARGPMGVLCLGGGGMAGKELSCTGGKGCSVSFPSPLEVLPAPTLPPAWPMMPDPAQPVSQRAPALPSCPWLSTRPSPLAEQRQPRANGIMYK